MGDFRFADPGLLLLLLLVAALLLWKRYRRQRTPAVSFPQTSLLRKSAGGSRAWARHLLLVLRVAAVSAVVFALARPQSGLEGQEVSTEGIDIILALDTSTSMLAEDIRPNRVAAAKEVAESFIRGRVNDRIGLVVFAGKAYTQCPLTLDYDILLSLFEDVDAGMIEDGTAIGTGLGVAVNRLKESEAKSKVIVLLTDGRNNRGEIDPKTAAQLAQTFGVRIYTVGAGAEGLAPYPVDDSVFGRRYVQVEVDIDEPMLQEIAQITGGLYFRATDRDQLEQIYREIDGLEKTEIQVTEFTRYSELFHIPLALAVLFLLAEMILSTTLLRRIP